MSQSAANIEPLITADQAAEILGVHVNWVYNQAAEGSLPSYRIGRQRKFRATDLEAFIQQHADGKIATVTQLEGRRR